MDALYPNPQIYHHLKAIFVHVPKTAGTSIENRLKQSPDVVVGGHTTALAFRRAHPECFAAYYKFAVVRAPLERFISAFRYLRGRAIHPALNNELIHRCDTLECFLDNLIRTPKIVRNIVHMVPQYEFVCDAAKCIIVDQIFQYERIEVAWRDICERLGIEQQPLPKMNISPRVTNHDDANPDLKAFVREAYASDFDLFGYHL